MYTDDVIKITILGNPVPKKNSCQIIKKNGRPIVIPSKNFLRYRKEVLKQSLPKLGIDFPINIKAVYYRKDRRKVDLCNLHESLCDLLVDAGTITDDNCKIVVSMNGSLPNAIGIGNQYLIIILPGDMIVLKKGNLSFPFCDIFFHL